MEFKVEGADLKSVSVVAPYMLGFLDTLDRSEPITNQMTLGKRGSGGSAIRATFSATILSEQRNDPA